MFSGVCTALVTPFLANKKIDYCALKILIEKQIEANVSAILVAGTTGEGSTIEDDEFEQLVSFSKRQIANRCKLVVSTGCNSTQKTIKKTKLAQKLGADICLIITPYYNKCTQAGLIKHYEKISKQTDIPFIVYNVPSRTGVNIEPSTAKKLCNIKNMCGIKEANSNINHITKLFNEVGGKTNIYCGNDNLSHIFYCLGASGTISVVSNVYPKQVVQSFKSFEDSLYFSQKFYTICEKLFVEVNPIPVKYALYCLGYIKNNLRLPLTSLSQKYRKQIKAEVLKNEE